MRVITILMRVLSKRYFLFALYLFFVLVTGLTSVEIIARLKHYEPFRYFKLDLKEPTMYKPDPVLGWTAKAGKYLAPPYVQSGASSQYTFFRDSSRATSEKSAPANYEIVLIGCSFTLGWAVSDSDTFGWKLQTEFPFLRVGNFGMGGYGTYQSLLLLRRLFNQGVKPRVVIYGFNIFHEGRNIANPNWLKHLTQYSKRGHVAIPYCSLNERGQLVEHPAMRWPKFPLQQYFAFPELLIKFYYALKVDTFRGFQNKMKITKKLLIEMRNLTKEHDAKLIVVMMSGEKNNRMLYFNFLRDHEVEVIDAPWLMTEDYRVPGEEHPNGKAHSLWADEIAKYLRTYMTNVKGVAATQ